MQKDIRIYITLALLFVALVILAFVIVKFEKNSKDEDWEKHNDKLSFLRQIASGITMIAILISKNYFFAFIVALAEAFIQHSRYKLERKHKESYKKLLDSTLELLEKN
ncbi:MAG: hypothetical protein ACRCZ2_06605 [Fusobacteriaceae bacterium]